MTKDYDLAGFSDPDGRLGRSVPAGQIYVPERVSLKDNHILWRMGEEPKSREVSRSMLNQFIRLTDASSVLRFAREWGVLAFAGGTEDDWRLPGREFLTEGVEPIAAWQYYSERAQALLNIAAAL